MKRITRRKFLKTMAASALALTAAGTFGACRIRPGRRAGLKVRRFRDVLRSWADTASSQGTEQGDSTEKAALTLGTGGASGLYYAVGNAMAAILSDKLTMSSLQATVSGGSRANIQMIEDGTADLAIAQNDVMFYAAAGTHLFEYEGMYDSFRTVCGLYPEACQCLCFGGIKSFEELRATQEDLARKEAKLRELEQR